MLDAKDIEAMPVLEEPYFKGMISNEIIFRAYYNASENTTKTSFLRETTAGDIVEYLEYHIHDEEVFEHYHYSRVFQF